MDLFAVGLSLRSVPLPALEALSDDARLARVESRLRALPGIRESVRLLTCHRALFLLGVSRPLRNASSLETGSAAAASHRRGDPVRASLDAARAILAEEAGSLGLRAEGAPLEVESVTALEGEDAFRHLVEIATGLLSPIEGETEILGQLRAAYADAVERGAAGRILGGAMHRVFRAARRIRARAGWPSTSSSWGEFLADAIVSESAARSGDTVAVLGSGSLAQTLTLALRARGILVAPIATREQVAGRAGRNAKGARVLVTVSGRGRILGASDPLLADQAGRPSIYEIWDLGMPRNVDPGVAALPGVRLRTLADIPTLASATDARREARRAAEALVDEEVDRWIAWRAERDAAATLVRLGRLLELSAGADGEGIGGEARGGASGTSFRRELLKAFTAIARDARDEDEASAHLALFEDALRRVAASTFSATAREAVGRRSAHLPTSGRDESHAGRVSLVGAGPGAGGLLTLEGARRLAEADVVYHDALAGDEVLVHCRPEARLVSVGKRRGHASASQAEIEAALVRDAKAGLRVVRLKGGDPFVFGRGGEEGLTLARAGVPFEVVPGVSSGIAAPALAGIPLTHRGIASSAAFVTAHDLGEDAPGAERRARLGHLARGAETLVVFMAGAELARVRRTLLEAGLAGDTPAAVIESGTTADQRVAVGALESLETLAEGLRGGPALVVVGGTVALAAALGRGDQRTADVAVVGEIEAQGAPERAVAALPRRRHQDRRRAG